MEKKEIEETIFLILQEEMNKAKGKDPFRLSNEGEYFYKVNHYIVVLFDLIEKLEKIIIHSKRFPNSKYYEGNDIYLSDYVDYHYEVYIHTVNTILDIMKLAINHTYDLKLADRDCSWNNIKNESIDQELKNVINSYYSYFKTTIDLRHANTHRAENTSTLFIKYSGYLTVKKMTKRIGIEFPEDLQKLVPELVLNYKLRQYRKEKVLDMIEGKEKAKKHIDSFVYEIQKEVLKRYNNGRLETTEK